MYGVCGETLRKSLVKCPCQKKVMRSAKGVGVFCIHVIHQVCSAPMLSGFVRDASSPPGNASGSAGFDSTSRSTVMLKPSFTDCSYSARL